MTNPKVDLSHKSRAEKEEREERGTAMLTGREIKERQEVSNSPTAHKEFLRLMKIMKAIGKNDALYEAQINRMAELTGETDDLRIQRDTTKKRIDQLEEKLESGDGDFDKLNRSIAAAQKMYLELDKQIMKKREMLSKLETTNCFTVSTSTRTVNTKLPEEIDPVAAALLG